MEDSNLRLSARVIQRTQGNAPVFIRVTSDETEEEVPVWTDPYGDPVGQPISFPDGNGKFYVNSGGEYTAHYTWTAADDSEQTHEEKHSIPHPPECPTCNKRVKELADYVCYECRFG